MDTQSLYYIKKYNNLIEQINRLKHENNLLEGLASGTLSDPQRDTTTSASSSSTSSSNPTLPNPPSTPPNPPPFNPDITGDATVDGADLGAILAYWGNPYGGSELGSVLSYWGQNPNPTDPDPTDPDPTDPDSPGGPANPPPQTYYDFNRPRGTSIRDIASLSNRNFVNNFGL
jgi:hypothetical protein